MTSSLSWLHDNTQTHHTRQDSCGRVITQRPLPDSIKLLKETDIHPLAEFAPAVPKSERPQTYALGRAATGIG